MSRLALPKTTLITAGVVAAGTTAAVIFGANHSNSQSKPNRTHQVNRPTPPA